MGKRGMKEVTEEVTVKVLTLTRKS